MVGSGAGRGTTVCIALRCRNQSFQPPASYNLLGCAPYSPSMARTSARRPTPVMRRGHRGAGRQGATKTRGWYSKLPWYRCECSTSGSSPRVSVRVERARRRRARREHDGLRRALHTVDGGWTCSASSRARGLLSASSPPLPHFTRTAHFLPAPALPKTTARAHLRPGNGRRPGHSRGHDAFV